MDASENRSVAIAWMGLGAIVALACASAITAAAALVFTALDKPSPSLNMLADAPVAFASAANSREVVARLDRQPQAGECEMVLWKSGTVYCVHK